VLFLGWAGVGWRVGPDALAMAHPKECPLMSSKSKNLTHRQQSAVNELLNGKRFDQVAEAIGVNPKTVSRWFNDPAFRAEYYTQLSAYVDYAFLPFISDVEEAREALLDAMRNPHFRGASTKRMAAVAVLDQARRISDNNLEKRVAEIEAAIRSKGL
jgi:hypothetical protein